MGTYFSEIAELLRYKELLRNLVVRDIKVRYKRSVLGFFWVMLNPLLMMVILSMVFSGLFRISTQNYTAYLLSGIILWNFFSQSTSASVFSLLSNSNLITYFSLSNLNFGPLFRLKSCSLHFIFTRIPICRIARLNGMLI